VDPHEYTIRNSQGCIGPLGAVTRSIDLEHTRFVAKQGSDKVWRDSPLLGHLNRRPVLLRSEVVRVRLATILVAGLLSPGLEQL
jgi:hypothetical protein